jgi:hypothetical protein
MALEPYQVFPFYLLCEQALMKPKISIKIKFKKFRLVVMNLPMLAEYYSR